MHPHLVITMRDSFIISSQTTPFKRIKITNIYSNGAIGTSMVSVEFNYMSRSRQTGKTAFI